MGYALRSVQTDARAANLNTLAAVYMEMGRLDDARETLMKGIEKQEAGEAGPADWYVLGRIAERLSLPDEAKAAYARIAEPTVAREGSAWALAQKRRKLLP